MKPLKIKTLWALDVYFNESLIQVNTFRYKKDALKNAINYGNFEIVKRRVITDKY